MRSVREPGIRSDMVLQIILKISTFNLRGKTMINSRLLGKVEYKSNKFFWDHSGFSFKMDWKVGEEKVKSREIRRRFFQNVGKK